MKRLLYILVALCLLAGCGVPEETSETAYTEEELFLQEAYWYLQSDEKEILTWENGVLEDYCAEESQKIISPEGEMEIQGQQLKRVQYIYWNNTEVLYGGINLYFTGDGAFLGTDYSTTINGEEHPYLGAYYDGDISMWVFLSSPEVGVDDSLTVNCVLKKTDGTVDTYSAFGDVMEVAIYQDGCERTSGINATGILLDFAQEPVVVTARTMDKSWWGGSQADSEEDLSGLYTIRVTVSLTEQPSGEFNEERHTTLTLTKFLKFTVA